MRDLKNSENMYRQNEYVHSSLLELCCKFDMSLSRSFLFLIVCDITRIDVIFLCVCFVCTHPLNLFDFGNFLC